MDVGTVIVFFAPYCKYLLQNGLKYGPGNTQSFLGKTLKAMVWHACI